MKNSFVEIVFILDRSGSMHGLEQDTIGGFNRVISEQKEKEERALLTTVLFDNEYEVIHERLDIKEIKNLTEKEYFVRGTTALLDAVGKSIENVLKIHKNLKSEDKPEKVLFVITTDGYENSSKEYSYAKVKQLITHQQEYYNWDFIFLGANIDAAKEAERFGLRKEYASNYHADSKGTSVSFHSINEAISDVRAYKKINKNWNKDVEEDYKERK